MKSIGPGLASVLLAVIGAALLPPHATGAEQPRSKEQLTAQVQYIFSKHCFACHGPDEKTSQAGLHILDHTQLTDGRGLVIPRFPNHSELLDLVTDGSMPPGNRPKLSDKERAALRDWILQGAAPFSFVGDDYVQRMILEDVRTLDPAARKTARYFSLNHLLSDVEARGDLDKQRDALAKAVAYLAKGKPVRLTAFESTNTIFRVDIGELGWDRQPFTVLKPNGLEPKRDKNGKPERSPINLFDLVLLEYPYGRIDPDAELFQQLVAEFLRPADPVRPIPYVRADWFIAVATQPPLARDFGKQEKDHFPATPRKLDVGLAEAGIPIIPLDALSVPNSPAGKQPFEVELTARNAGNDAAKTVFKQNEKMQIGVLSNENLLIELVWTFANGQKVLVDVKPNRITAHARHRFGPRKDEGWPMEEIGPDVFTLFAYAGSTPLPAAQLIRSEDNVYRVVHAYCEYPRNGGPLKLLFDPGKVVKKTLKIETVK
jgi:mono/diheme cytochrome c family protein